MTLSDVVVQVDRRLRLLSAVLATTRYPQAVQVFKPHRPHAHARALTRYLTDRGASQHPAALGLQRLLDQGAPLEAMFMLMLRFGWPQLIVPRLPDWAPQYWNHHLWDFYTRYALAAFWSDHSGAWAEAQAQVGHIFDRVNFSRFLEPFVGHVNERLVFMPNLSYPADQVIGIRTRDQIIAMVPPPLAWGDSPPWPYDEDSQISYAYTSALTQYGRLLLRAYLHQNARQLDGLTDQALPVGDAFRALHPTWEDQLITLLVAGLVTIYLEDHISPAESQSYLLIEQKVAGITALPGAVSVLRRYLREYGSRYSCLVDFLPLFPIQLRVASKIMSL